VVGSLLFELFGSDADIRKDLDPIISYGSRLEARLRPLQ
jgi:hypothetical protein